MGEPGEGDVRNRRECRDRVAHAQKASWNVHDGDGDKRFDEVATVTGEDTHLRLRVMNRVEAPEQRNLVTNDVGELVDEIHHENGRDGGGHESFESREINLSEVQGPIDNPPKGADVLGGPVGDHRCRIATAG